jgi:hypothetical protein
MEFTLTGVGVLIGIGASFAFWILFKKKPPVATQIVTHRLSVIDKERHDLENNSVDKDLRREHKTLSVNHMIIKKDMEYYKRCSEQCRKDLEKSKEELKITNELLEAYKEENNELQEYKLHLEELILPDPPKDLDIDISLEEAEGWTA